MSRDIGLGLLYYSAIVAVASVAAYAVMHPGWRRSGDGHHVMSYMASVALILGVWTAGAFFDTPPWWQSVRLVAFMTLPVVLTWRLILIVQSWWQRRRPAPSPEHLE